jgi:hypothetical protein
VKCCPSGASAVLTAPLIFKTSGIRTGSIPCAWMRSRGRPSSRPISPTTSRASSGPISSGASFTANPEPAPGSRAPGKPAPNRGARVVRKRTEGGHLGGARFELCPGEQGWRDGRGSLRRLPPRSPGKAPFRGSDSDPVERAPPGPGLDIRSCKSYTYLSEPGWRRLPEVPVCHRSCERAAVGFVSRGIPR